MIPARLFLRRSGTLCPKSPVSQRERERELALTAWVCLCQGDKIDMRSPARIRLDLEQWDFFFSPPSSSSRHIIGQGNKGPPTRRNWIRIGIHCERGAGAAAVAAKAAAACKCLTPFR